MQSAAPTPARSPIVEPPASSVIALLTRADSDLAARKAALQVRSGRAAVLAQALGAQRLPIDGFDSHWLSISIRTRPGGGKRFLS